MVTVLMLLDDARANLGASRLISGYPFVDRKRGLINAFHRRIVTQRRFFPVRYVTENLLSQKCIGVVNVFIDNSNQVSIDQR